jgi:hypothetical protein
LRRTVEEGIVGMDVQVYEIAHSAQYSAQTYGALPHTAGLRPSSLRELGI